MFCDCIYIHQIFELPHCDHRGVSSDHRMLERLRDILGLQRSKEMVNETIDHKLDAEWDHHIAKTRDRFVGCPQRSADMPFCAFYSKFGLLRAPLLRKYIGRLAVVLALGSVALMIFVMVYGASMDHQMIKSYAWGIGGYRTTNTELRFQKTIGAWGTEKEVNYEGDYAFWTGILTLTWIGAGVHGMA